MVDYFVYFCMVWLGYVSGYLLGWVAGSSIKDEEQEADPPKKDSCTDYSHLRRFAKAPTSNLLDKELYTKVYDVKVYDDEYKIDKIV